jgi:hypothetical protein
MEKKKVLLTRLWDGHAAGEVVEEDAPCADSMVRKGYGIPYEEPKKPKSTKNRDVEGPGKGPRVETADAQPAVEQAVVTPKIGGKRGD